MLPYRALILSEDSKGDEARAFHTKTAFVEACAHAHVRQENQGKNMEGEHDSARKAEHSTRSTRIEKESVNALRQIGIRHTQQE